VIVVIFRVGLRGDLFEIGGIIHVLSLANI
jgi:hypothetical protein